MTSATRDLTPTGFDPPPESSSEYHGGSGWVTLLTAPNEIEAHLVAGRLESGGVEVRFQRDHSGPSWLLTGSDPRAPVTLLVLRIQLEDARLVLAEVALEQPAYAGHPQGRTGLRPLTWWVIALSLGAALTAVGLARTAEATRGCSLGAACAERTLP